MKDYYLFKRKNSKYWYYYLISSTGEKSTAKSTKCIKKWEAEEYVKKIAPFQIHNIKRLTFAMYAEHFFDDNSLYIEEGKRNNRMTNGYVMLLKVVLNNHLLPYFSKLVLSEITVQHVRQFRIFLSKEKKLSNQTINNYVAVFGIIMKKAYEDRLITFVPTFNLKTLDSSNQKRGAFTSKEIVDMLHDSWGEKNDIYRKFCIIAACTGMRMGEIRGMTLDHINDGFYFIEYQYHSVDKCLTEPKQGSKRYIPLSQKLEKFIRECGTRNFVFSNTKNKIISVMNIEIHFKAHFTQEIIERKNKIGLTFHSLRHYYRTMCKKIGMDDFLSEKILGHKVQGLISTYTDVTNDMFLKFIPLQEKIFDMIMTGVIPDELA